MSKLRTYKAICDTNIKPCPPPKNVEAKIMSRSQGEFSPKQYTCIILYWSSSLALPVSEHPPPSHFSYLFILFPSHFNNPFGQMRRPDTCPTALKSHKSGTPLVHHFIPFYFTVSRPGATDPRAKHQALAPSLPIWFPVKSMFVTVLLTFNASARACGQKRWQTKLNRVKETQVWNTTGTPLHSILFGLGSFIANAILSQVDVRNALVGFQYFGKRLWTKTMAHHVKPENLQGDLRH